ncbi:MAG: hypothetical protein AB8B83_07360 [Bdellovibrionales bacterium]
MSFVAEDHVNRIRVQMTSMVRTLFDSYVRHSIQNGLYPDNHETLALIALDGISRMHNYDRPILEEMGQADHWFDSIDALEGYVCDIEQAVCKQTWDVVGALEQVAETMKFNACLRQVGSGQRLVPLGTQFQSRVTAFPEALVRRYEQLEDQFDVLADVRHSFKFDRSIHTPPLIPRIFSGGYEFWGDTRRVVDKFDNVFLLELKKS